MTPMERWENETEKESYWHNAAGYEETVYTSSDQTSVGKRNDGEGDWSTAGTNGSST